MKTRSSLFLVLLVLGLTACSSSPKAKRGLASASRDDMQELSGFQLRAMTPSHKEYTFRQEGALLISSERFTTRQKAIEFCQQQPGFEMTDMHFGLFLSMANLPFDTLFTNHYVEQSVLNGSQTLSGQPRGGIMFWFKGTDAEEKEISAAPNVPNDVVATTLNGCGPNCSGLDSLARVNERLQKLGAPPRSLHAVCYDAKLKKALWN